MRCCAAARGQAAAIGPWRARSVSTAVNGRAALRSRSEPLLIPRLQSRFADFPWARCPLTRGCSPRRPVAVLGTVAAYARIVSGRRRPGVRAPCGASSRAEPFPSHAAGHAGTTSGHAGRRRGCCAAVAIAQAAGSLACVPFGACGALAVRLGPSHPSTMAVATETCSTSVAPRALSLLQPRSGPARGPGGLGAAVRAARRHALPGSRQRRVGRGLQRDQFSGRLDSAGEL